MANIRMLPTLPPHATAVNGRIYTCPAGSSLDVPDFDARILLANGWVQVAQVGTTAQRPTGSALFNGMFYHDTVVGMVIVWEGNAWRRPDTAAAV